MSSLSLVDLEQFGYSLIGTKMPIEYVGTMNDPLVVYMFGLPNCIIVKILSLWKCSKMVPMKAWNLQLVSIYLKFCLP